MKLLGWGVIGGAVWLWIEQPLALAVAGGILAGIMVGYGLRALSTASGPSGAVIAAPVADPALARLVGMGFRAEEATPLLAKARMRGEPDPVAFVMRSLIR
jgi:hypothetical protein